MVQKRVRKANGTLLQQIKRLGKGGGGSTRVTDERQCRSGTEGTGHAEGEAGHNVQPVVDAALSRGLASGTAASSRGLGWAIRNQIGPGGASRGSSLVRPPNQPESFVRRLVLSSSTLAAKAGSENARPLQRTGLTLRQSSRTHMILAQEPVTHHQLFQRYSRALLPPASWRQMVGRQHQPVIVHRQLPPRRAATPQPTLLFPQSPHTVERPSSPPPSPLISHLPRLTAF